MNGMIASMLIGQIIGLNDMKESGLNDMKESCCLQHQREWLLAYSH